MNYYLSIDAGTSIVKVVIFNLKFKVVFNQSINNDVITNSKGKSEINMNKFWLTTSKCIKESIMKSKITTAMMNWKILWKLFHYEMPFSIKQF